MTPFRVPAVSIVLTTYNRPEALDMVLRGLAAQVRSNFEVVVADDGSGLDTARLLRDLAPMLPFRLRHVWQADQGFRAAAARNRALAVTEGDYVIFLDGDCIPPRDFVERHCRLAEKGWFVAGNRVLCGPAFTRRVLARRLPLWQWGTWHWLRAYRRGEINRLAPLLHLPGQGWRKRRARQWEGAKTCNLAAYRENLIGINGFDEAYQGWGHEDADLVTRLIRFGILRKDARFAAPVFHLWHPPQDRQREAENRRRLCEVLDNASRLPVAVRGLNQYLDQQ